MTQRYLRRPPDSIHHRKARRVRNRRKDASRAVGRAPPGAAWVSSSIHDQIGDDGSQNLMDNQMVTAMMTVLLVNAHADETQMYRACLEFTPGGYSVGVCDPADAVDCAVATQPDVIVTDLVLQGPTEDAVDLIRRLRRDFRTHHIAIVVITGWSRPADYERAMDAGCDVFVEKPCQPEIFRIEIRRAAAVARRRTFNRTADLGHATATAAVIATLDRSVFSATSKTEREEPPPENTDIEATTSADDVQESGFQYRLGRTPRRAAPCEGNRVSGSRSQKPTHGSVSHESTRSPGVRARSTEARGGGHGKALEDWLQAEREIDEAMERPRGDKGPGHES